MKDEKTIRILRKSEYDFGAVSPKLYSALWNHESAREYYFHYPSRWPWSPTHTQLPFLELPKEQQVPFDIWCAFWESPGPAESFEAPEIHVHKVEIDWTAHKSRIVASFKEWVERRYPELGKPRPARKGRRNDYLARLCDLAIYRVTSAGYTHNEARQMLGWILKRRMHLDHFSDARRRMKARLKSMNIAVVTGIRRGPEGRMGRELH